MALERERVALEMGRGSSRRGEGVVALERGRSSTVALDEAEMK